MSAMQLRPMLRAEGVKGQSKLPLILAGVGWNGVEWVWRGYNSGTTPRVSRGGNLMLCGKISEECLTPGASTKSPSST